MARCRHRVERTTLHTDRGATCPQFFEPLFLDVGCRQHPPLVPDRSRKRIVLSRRPTGATWCHPCLLGLLGHDDRERQSGPLGNTTLIENRNDLPRLPTVTDSSAADIARAELLMLLEALHEKLNSCFEDLRRLPQTTARFEARNRHSISSE